MPMSPARAARPAAVDEAFSAVIQPKKHRKKASQRHPRIVQSNKHPKMRGLSQAPLRKEQVRKRRATLRKEQVRKRQIVVIEQVIRLAAKAEQRRVKQITSCSHRMRPKLERKYAQERAVTQLEIKSLLDILHEKRSQTDGKPRPLPVQLFEKQKTLPSSAKVETKSRESISTRNTSNGVSLPKIKSAAKTTSSRISSRKEPQNKIKKTLANSHKNTNKEVRTFRKNKKHSKVLKGERATLQSKDIAIMRERAKKDQTSRAASERAATSRLHTNTLNTKVRAASERVATSRSQRNFTAQLLQQKRKLLEEYSKLYTEEIDLNKQLNKLYPEIQHTARTLSLNPNDFQVPVGDNRGNLTARSNISCVSIFTNIPKTPLKKWVPPPLNIKP